MEPQFSILTYIALYFLLGALWASVLEKLTTGKLPGELGSAWSNGERLGHAIFWPISFISFVVAFFRNL